MWLIMISRQLLFMIIQARWYDTRTNRELVTGYAGIKGYEIGVNYTVARNVMAAFNYFGYQGADNNNIKDRMMWTQLYYIF